MELSKLIEATGISGEWKPDGTEVITGAGDWIGVFDTDSGKCDRACVAMAAHCVNNLPVLVQAVSDYIEGPGTHGSEALVALQKALAKSQNVDVEL